MFVLLLCVLFVSLSWSRALGLLMVVVVVVVPVVVVVVVVVVFSVVVLLRGRRFWFGLLKPVRIPFVCSPSYTSAISAISAISGINLAEFRIFIIHNS